MSGALRREVVHPGANPTSHREKSEKSVSGNGGFSWFGASRSTGDGHRVNLGDLGIQKLILRSFLEIHDSCAGNGFDANHASQAGSSIIMTEHDI